MCVGKCGPLDQLRAEETAIVETILVTNVKWKYSTGETQKEHDRTIYEVWYESEYYKPAGPGTEYIDPGHADSAHDAIKRKERVPVEKREQLKPLKQLKQLDQLTIVNEELERRYDTKYSNTSAVYRNVTELLS